MTLPVEVVRKRGEPSTEYSPSRITLYGIVLISLDAWVGKAFGGTARPTKVQIRPQPNVSASATASDQYYPALIYAYAYQGHCYNLPEPVILIVEGEGDDATGFDFDDNPGYQMWSVEKLDRTMQLEPTSDTFEEVILKRGLSGAKQPVSYASRLQISHRGGKLTE